MDAEGANPTSACAPGARAAVPPAALEPESAATLAEAYDFCSRLARSHYENFSVASWLMPRAMRKHMHAIYAYARMADDFADEEHDPVKLDEWERELDLAYAGAPRHPVFVALADTAHRFDIPRAPFADLLHAFRSDLDFGGFENGKCRLQCPRKIDRRIRHPGRNIAVGCEVPDDVRGASPFGGGVKTFNCLPWATYVALKKTKVET